MQLTKVKLLTPRVQVRFNHPHSLLKEGDILTLCPTDNVYKLSNSYTIELSPKIVDDEKYSYLFGKLPWYACRPIEHLPAHIYISSKEIEIVPIIWRDISSPFESSPSISDDGGAHWVRACLLPNILPATPEEYQQYLQLKNKTTCQNS